MSIVIGGPWSGRAVKALIATDVAAVATIFAGWYLASGSDRARQVPGINLAIAALCLSALAHGLWLLQGRRAVGSLRSGLLPSTLVTRSATAPSAAVKSLPVSAPEMILYHGAECLLVAGKSVAPATVADHERAGRAQCPVCQP